MIALGITSINIPTTRTEDEPAVPQRPIDT
jgi:hypothetical protein